MRNPWPLSDPFGITRRHFFAKSARGLGAVALAGLLPRAWPGPAQQPQTVGSLPGFPNFAPKAKRVIYLFQSGAPSQMDLLDYKPLLNKLNGEQLPGKRSRRTAPSHRDVLPAIFHSTLAGSIF